MAYAKSIKRVVLSQRSKTKTEKRVSQVPLCRRPKSKLSTEFGIMQTPFDRCVWGRFLRTESYNIRVTGELLVAVGGRA